MTPTPQPFSDRPRDSRKPNQVRASRQTKPPSRWNVLEIGTLGGYSTIWLARALPPGGRLVTLEADPRHAEVARANISRAGLGGVVELVEGRALDTLPTLTERGYGPFDLSFIDADKAAIPEYFTWTLGLSRPC